MVDKKWVNKQLDAAGYTAKTGPMFAIREVVELLFLQLGHQKLADDAQQRTAVELFYKLYNGHSIAADIQGDNHEWTQFQLGDWPVGTIIRVKQDAYDGEAGQTHNGRAGTLVAARGGYAVVQYDSSADGTGHRHAPNILEALVR